MGRRREEREGGGLIVAAGENMANDPLLLKAPCKLLTLPPGATWGLIYSVSDYRPDQSYTVFL